MFPVIEFSTRFIQGQEVTVQGVPGSATAVTVVTVVVVVRYSLSRDNLALLELNSYSLIVVCIELVSCVFILHNGSQSQLSSDISNNVKLSQRTLKRVFTILKINKTSGVFPRPEVFSKYLLYSRDCTTSQKANCCPWREHLSSDLDLVLVSRAPV